MRAATGPRGHLSLLGGGCIRNAGIETAVSGGVPPPVRSRPAAGARHARGGVGGVDPDAGHRFGPAWRRAPRHARGGFGVGPDGSPIPMGPPPFRPAWRRGASRAAALSRRKDARGAPDAGTTAAGKRRGQRGHREDDAGTRKGCGAPDAGTTAAGSAAGNAVTGKTTRWMRHAPRRPRPPDVGGRKRREPRGHLSGKEVKLTSPLSLVVEGDSVRWLSLIPTVALSRVLPKSIWNPSCRIVGFQVTLRTLSPA